MYIDHQMLSKLAQAGIGPGMLDFASFGQTALKSTEQLFGLGMASLRANWERSVNTAQELMACSNPQERLSLMTKRTREDIEANLSYGRELAGIALAAQSELLREIEAKNAHARQQLTGAIEEWARNAPAGAQAGATLLSTAFQNMNKGYDQWKETVRQSREALMSQVSSAGQKPAGKAASPQSAAKA